LVASQTITPIVVGLGYRAVEQPTLTEKIVHRSDMRITRKRIAHPELCRPIEMASLGCHVVGAAMPHVDTSDADTQALGGYKRMGRPMNPVKDREFYRDFRRFVADQISRQRIRPIDPTEDTSVYRWLERTDYPQSRKTELLDLYHKTLGIGLAQEDATGTRIYKNFDVKKFTKDESYSEFKHARGIYARDDVAKIFFGPYVKLMEERIYDHEEGFKEFIKHVPVHERPRHISDALARDGHVYVATDYSSFEAHFSVELMFSCEMILYEHMLSLVPDGQHVYQVMEDVFLGNNKISSKRLKERVLACRMSGEMTTSLGNGFTNLMLMRYVCSKRNLPAIGVIEGDDGLFSFPSGKTPKTEDFTDLGCIIKLQVHHRASIASFCGQIFDEIEQAVVTDPRVVLTKLGWTTKQYAFARPQTKLMLLRAKAMSALYQYPSCPIVAAFARYAMRMTRGYDVRRFLNSRSLDWWDRQLFRAALKFGINNLMSGIEIGSGTRRLVEEQYGLTVECQLSLEKYFDELDVLSPVNNNVFFDTLPEAWKSYYTWYVLEVTDRSSQVFIPWANHAPNDFEPLSESLDPLLDYEVGPPDSHPP